MLDTPIRISILTMLSYLVKVETELFLCMSQRHAGKWMSVGKEKLFLVRVEFAKTAHFIRNSTSAKCSCLLLFRAMIIVKLEVMHLISFKSMLL